MRRLIYFLIIFILIGGIILTAYAPDEISTVFIVLMEMIVFLGVVFGVFPLLQFYQGFDNGMENIERALEVQTSSTWSVMAQLEEFCPLSAPCKDLLEKIIDRQGLSARAYTRIIKIARTIADLAGVPDILPEHLAEAASYRFLDRRHIMGL